MTGQPFDAYLCHNGKERGAVRELATALTHRGLRVWLDEWELAPGRSWHAALEEILETTRAVLVLVGRDGIGPWQDREMQAHLMDSVRRSLPIVPVLLPWWAPT